MLAFGPLQETSIASTNREAYISAAYQCASFLTDPLCLAHQFYRQIPITDDHYKTASKTEKWATKSMLFLGAASCGLCSLITTIPGGVIRYFAILLQTRPFLTYQGNAEYKQLTDPTISLLSWNLCCVPAGYSITDGGVLPWSFRISKLASKILDQDADIVCLYEIFDIKTALRLIDDLEDTYSRFYYNIGPKAIGPSSGMFVASKLELDHPDFIPFPQNALDGRAKNCGKGVFSFDVVQDHKNIARIFSTHLQHSEIPDRPTPGELAARAAEMDIILEEIRLVEDKAIIFTGDLNLDDDEYNRSDWKDYFNKGDVEEGFTWGGDAYATTLTGKIASCASNLDHTMVLRYRGDSIVTTLVETNFDAGVFNPDALSDHKGLLSIIKIEKI